MMFLCDFVLRTSLIIMSNVVFVKKQGNGCFIDRRNLKCFIFLYPNMSGAWIQARRADDLGSCVYELVLCELVFKSDNVR